CVEHSQRQRESQRFILPVPQISLPQDFHPNHPFACSRMPLHPEARCGFANSRHEDSSPALNTEDALDGSSTGVLLTDGRSMLFAEKNAAVTCSILSSGRRKANPPG